MSDQMFNPTHVDAVQQFQLGQQLRHHDGQEYMYVEADGAIDEDAFVAIEADYGAAEVTHALWSGSALGGVAVVAIPDESFGWVMRRGQHDIEVAASCAEGTALRTTGTAGRLDDATGGTTEAVHGIVLTAARSGSNGTQNAVMENPRGFA